MKINNLSHKNRLIIGLGQTGLAVARYLFENDLPFKVMDSRYRNHDAPLAGKDELASFAPDALVTWSGKGMLQFDQLVVSPGIAVSTAEIVQAQKLGVEVVGDVELFAQAVTLPVIAITGSNGKSTVTELTGELLKAAGKRALVGGNIGLPVLEMLKQDGEVAVLELSSFQLETTRSLRPEVATVLNISEDHLDRYVSYQAYIDAKKRIYNNAKVIVVNQQDSHTWSVADKVITFGLTDSDWQVNLESHAIEFNGNKIIPIADLALQGVHNALNVAAALALLSAMDIEIEKKVIQTAKNYQGLAHRCQLASVKNGVTFINDSKATNVGATVAALNSFAPQFGNNIILIAGGDAKGADLSDLQQALSHGVKGLVTLGKDGDAIANLADDTLPVTKVLTLAQAFEAAIAMAQANDLVLLSPACASLDMFKDYQQRGQQFMDLVDQLEEKAL